MIDLSSQREVLAAILEELGERLEDLAVITADVGKSTRVYRFGKKFPERYFNVGVSEQHMISFAAGLSMAGARPIVVGFSVFLMRAWEQIRNSLDIMNLNVKIVGTHSGFSDFADGSTHQSLEDISLMRSLPNMKVVVPADSIDIQRSLPQIVESVHGPLYYRIGRDESQVITSGCTYKFSLGRGYVLRDGYDIAVVGAGPILSEAIKASDELKKEGVSVAVINLLSIKPIDEELLEKYARKTGRIVALEEHSIYGGVGSAIAEVLARKYPVKIKFVGTSTYGRSAKSTKELWSHFGLNSASVVAGCKDLLKSSK
ncbi:MAG: transketolase family protein [Caldisphaeraceae archaeon]|nr:transketolase family protein [Caldisphaeraceae archaeon]